MGQTSLPRRAEIVDNPVWRGNFTGIIRERTSIAAKLIAKSAAAATPI